MGFGKFGFFAWEDEWKVGNLKWRFSIINSTQRRDTTIADKREFNAGWFIADANACQYNNCIKAR